jgi:hypothetical protein
MIMAATITAAWARGGGSLGRGRLAEMMCVGKVASVRMLNLAGNITCLPGMSCLMSASELDAKAVMTTVMTTVASATATFVW